MDSRACTGRHASTSHAHGRSLMSNGRAGEPCSLATGSRHRSSWSRCRSVFDSSEGFPTCKFPTTDITGQDWRAFRAHLVAWEHSARRAAQQSRELQRPPYPPLVSGESWAHPLPHPEPGCLLLARHENMEFFNGAVILMASHDDGVGSVGFVLNKPSDYQVENVDLLSAAPGFKQAYGSQRYHVGGPIHYDSVTLLHRFVGINGSQRIADGMYMGGLPDAIRLVSAGLLRPSSFLLVLGKSVWHAGQLQQEIADGWWHVISASPDLVLPAATEPATATEAQYSASAPSACASANCSGRDGKGQQKQQQELLQRPKRHGGGTSAGGAGGGGAGRQRGGGGGNGGGGAHSDMYSRIARLAMRGGRVSA